MIRPARSIAAASLALFVAGCGTGSQVVRAIGPLGHHHTAVADSGPGANKHQARTEAERLLTAALAPPGSVRLPSSSPLIPAPLAMGPAVGVPVSADLIDDVDYWRVPMAMPAALDWLDAHPPQGLTKSATASEGDSGRTVMIGSSYGAASSAAWTGAELAFTVAPVSQDQSVLRVDGMDLWINPTPVKDRIASPRLRVTLASGCPSSDRGADDVANPAPPLNQSLLPAGQPSAGLRCRYAGMSGRPFALLQQQRLDATAAQAVAAEEKAIPLGHTDGVTSCPMDDGSATILALAYPDETVDLWLNTTGCGGVSNGYILAGGA